MAIVACNQGLTRDHTFKPNIKAANADSIASRSLGKIFTLLTGLHLIAVRVRLPTRFPQLQSRRSVHTSTHEPHSLLNFGVLCESSHWGRNSCCALWFALQPLAPGSGLSSMSLVQKLQAATGKKSLLDILKCAGISIALDGNWCETVMQLSGE
jgi:hypothetical protein